MDNSSIASGSRIQEPNLDELLAIEYKSLIAAKEKMIADEIEKIFKEQDEIRDEKEKMYAKVNCQWPEQTGVIRIKVPHFEPLPFFRPYVKTKRNVAGRNFLFNDRKPYYNEKDEKFYKEYDQKYATVENSDQGDEEKRAMLADEHLIKLVEVALQPEGPGGLSKPNISHFEKIQRITNSKQSADELQGKYLDMTTSEEDKCKNIDYEAVKMKICRICCLINCELHPQPEIRKNFQREQVETGHDDEPCGDSCYKQNVAGVSHLNQDPWTIADSSLFKVTYQMLGKNYCLIAKCIQQNSQTIKTCKMVYDHAQIATNLPAVEEYQAEVKPEGPKKKKHQVSVKKWRSKMTAAHKGRKNEKFRNSYVPCDCQKCDKDCQCPDDFCEKFCLCPKDCIYRFPGCQCKGECRTKACLCWNAERECDSEICKCKSPFHDEPAEKKCLNFSTQLGIWKDTKMKPSTVVKGWGCFIIEDAKKGEFITEYTGELIDEEEAERRGKLYDHGQCSFLYQITKDKIVDSTYIGSKIKFANHSDKPNCKTIIMKATGDHRIAIFALRDLIAGEELFIDYGYSKALKQKLFKGKAVKVEKSMKVEKSVKVEDKVEESPKIAKKSVIKEEPNYSSDSSD